MAGLDPATPGGTVPLQQCPHSSWPGLTRPPPAAPCCCSIAPHSSWPGLTRPPPPAPCREDGRLDGRP